MADSTERCYYLQDDLGSPIRLLNGSGELTDSYGYDEFGQDLYGNQGIVQPFGYTGYQADGIAGTYSAQMREYKPELGRFAAVDVVKGSVIAPYTLNGYGYCWNNPQKYVDRDAAWPEWKDVDKVVQTIKTIGKYEKRTYTAGLDLSGTPGFWQYDGTIGISIDTKGNIALQGAVIGGVTAGTRAVGVVRYQTLTSASTVYDLEGLGTQIGASGLIPIPGAPVMAMVGGEFNYIGDISKKGPYEIGATFSEGIGYGEGGELHVQWGETKTLCSINIFDMWDEIYEKIGKTEQDQSKEEKE